MSDLTDTQRAYLCAFDDLLAARTEDHQQIAELAMGDFAAEMFTERALTPPSLRHARRGQHA